MDIKQLCLGFFNLLTAKHKIFGPGNLTFL